jgi:hypothetical protein
MSKNRGETILYWIIFGLGAIVAGYHTFMVNATVNPWYIALPSAIAVDGLLSYTMHSIRYWTGDKRIASFCGVLLFGFVSAVAQIIYHQTASGIPLDQWLQFVATYFIPIASGTGSFVTIAVIQLFKQEHETSPKQVIAPPPPPVVEVVQQTPPAQLEAVSNWPGVPAVATLAVGGGAETPIKRGPGRPPKAYNAVSEPAPKVTMSTRKS